MTLDELSRMQDVLFEQLRMGLPGTEQIAKALSARMPTWRPGFAFATHGEKRSRS
ncbi:MAG TPA: hypothetical protein VET27_01650 [Mycobacterium sp.]|nr:hypothetical protein [Mycobacterium sp.]